MPGLALRSSWRARPCDRRAAGVACLCRRAPADRTHRRRLTHRDARHQAFKVGDAVLAVAAAFGVDDDVLHVEPRHVLDDPRISLGPVDAGHGVEPDALAAGVDLEAEAVVLDLVDPTVGGRCAPPRLAVPTAKPRQRGTGASLSGYLGKALALRALNNEPIRAGSKRREPRPGGWTGASLTTTIGSHVADLTFDQRAIRPGVPVRKVLPFWKSFYGATCGV